MSEAAEAKLGGEKVKEGSKDQTSSKAKKKKRSALRLLIACL